MRSKWTLPLFIFTTLALVLLCYTPSGASEDNQVALIVDYGNGQVATRCVSFTEDSISGYEALARTGLPVETDFQTGGAAVCQIDGQGCPSNDCFCACRGGGDCKYWSYWHLNNGTWSYSAAGSGLYQVQDGMVEGWVWGLGSVIEASPPPIVPFSDICTAAEADTPTATATRPHTSTPMVLPTLAPTNDNLFGSPTAPPATAASTAVVTQPASSATITATIMISQPGAVPTLASPSTSIPPSLGVAGESLSPTPPGIERSVIESSTGSDGQTLSLPATEPQGLPSPTTAETQDQTPPAQAESGEIEPGAVLVGAAVEDVVILGTATPVEVAAVIGTNATLTENQAAPGLKEERESFNWTSYAGFTGLLLFLAALALIVYRRRIDDGEAGR